MYLDVTHLWVLSVLGAGGVHTLGECVFAASVPGEQEEGVTQQTVVSSGQQLLVGKRVRMAAPVVHEGVPVSVREGQHSLERPETRRDKDVLQNTPT